MKIPNPEEVAAMRRAMARPELADGTPRGRTIEEVTAIIVDVHVLGAAAAARKHRITTSAAGSLDRTWSRHPVVVAALEAARPQIEARVRAALQR